MWHCSATTATIGLLLDYGYYHNNKRSIGTTGEEPRVLFLRLSEAPGGITVDSQCSWELRTALDVAIMQHGFIAYCTAVTSYVGSYMY